MIVLFRSDGQIAVSNSPDAENLHSLSRVALDQEVVSHDVSAVRPHLSLYAAAQGGEADNCRSERLQRLYEIRLLCGGQIQPEQSVVVIDYGQQIRGASIMEVRRML